MYATQQDAPNRNKKIYWLYYVVVHAVGLLQRREEELRACALAPGVWGAGPVDIARPQSQDAAISSVSELFYSKLVSFLCMLIVKFRLNLLTLDDGLVRP
jgi:hypothetical protein